MEILGFFGEVIGGWGRKKERKREVDRWVDKRTEKRYRKTSVKKNKQNKTLLKENCVLSTPERFQTTLINPAEAVLISC